MADLIQLINKTEKIEQKKKIAIAVVDWIFFRFSSAFVPIDTFYNTETLRPRTQIPGFRSLSQKKSGL